MRRYQAVVRVAFGLVFIGGGVAHLVLGRLRPDDYAGFGQTALSPWLADLWVSFVMPNIGWLTILLGIFEIACGIGILRKSTSVFAVCAMIAFLGFVTILGYGYPATSIGEDLLKNRLATIVMAALLAPLISTALRRSREPLPITETR